MSQFESGSLANRGRNAASLPDSPLPRQTLNVPGLDVLPVAVQRSAFADSLLVDLGLIDRAAGIVAHGVGKKLAFESDVAMAKEHAANEAEQAANKARLTAAHNRTIAEGFGTSAINDAFPLIADRIGLSSELLSDEQIQARAKQDILASVAGLDQVSVDAAVKAATPEVVKAYTNRREQLRKIATATASEAVYSGAVNTTEPDKFTASVDALAALYPEQSRDTIAQDLQAKAVAYQSKYGTRDQLDRALSLTDTVDPFVRAKAEDDFATRQRAAESVVNQQADDYLASQLIQARDGATSLDAVERAYRANYGKVVGAEKLRSGLTAIDEARSRQAAALAKMNDKAVKQTVDQALRDDAAAAALSGGVWMLDVSKDAYKATKSDGTEYAPSDGEFRRAQQKAVDDAADAIKKANAATPEKGFADAIDLMALNKMPTTELSSLLNNAHAVASIDTLVPDRTKDGKPQATQAPPQLVAAITAYRYAKSHNAQVAAFTVEDDKARSLYDTVDFMATLPEYRRLDGEDEATWTGRLAVEAVTALDRAAWHGFGSQTNNISETKIDDALKATGSYLPWGQSSLRDAKNASYVRSAIRARSQFFMMSRNVGEDAAIDAATKSFYADHDLINGTWIDYRELGINKDALSLATSLATHEYVKQDAALNTSPDRREVKDAGDLAIVPDNHGGWVMVDATTLQPVNRNNVSGVGRFSTSDLMNMIAADGARRASQEAPRKAEDLRFYSAKQQGMQYAIRRSRLESNEIEMKLYKQKLDAARTDDEKAVYQHAIATLQDRIDGKVATPPVRPVVPAKPIPGHSGVKLASSSMTSIVTDLEKRLAAAKTAAERSIIQDTIDRLDESRRGVKD